MRVRPLQGERTWRPEAQPHRVGGTAAASAKRLHAEANESRSQHENRARALRRLRLTIALTLRAPVSLSDYAPPATLAAALVKPPSHRDPARFPVLAALFDVLEAAGWRLSDAAARLNVNTAAISRLLAEDDAVWRAAAERRVSHDLPSLHRDD